LSISTSGTISGTPTVSGTFNYTVTVTDSAGNTGTLNCSVTVAPPVSATCVSITAVQGIAITPVTMLGSGGLGGPYTFTATGLPAGLSISTSGTISGTPTVSGTFNYTVTVTDSAGNTGTLNCSVTVAPPVSATCVSITAVQGIAITPVTMAGSGGLGGPYTFTATGLPAGLSISTSGTISGTPTVSGTFNYTVTVTDSAGNTGTLNCSVTVAPPVSATCVAITAVQGIAITPVTMVGSGGSGGPYTFTATGLPAGLSISTSGTISGTPTVSGTFNYTVTVTDSAGHTGTLNCSVTVAPPVSATCVSITAVQGIAITPVTMAGSGGLGGPYTFTATGLPAGLSISTSGTISGTPTVSGTFNYTVTVTDAAGHTGTLNCSVTVAPPVSATCVSIAAVQGIAITPVTMPGSGGSGGPYTFTATGLPAGLSISTAGTISGTPTVSGTFNYTVTVTDAAGHTGTLNCSVTVAPPVSATCVSIDAVQGDAIVSATLVGSGGTGPYTFTATGLPAGLSISTSGTISGTPTVSGTFNYTVTITDSKGNKGTLSCSIVVLPPVSVSCVTFNAVQSLVIAPVSLTGSGGAGGAYTYTATGLPPGLTMSSSGVISGTPTASGTFNYTVTITDTGGNQGSGRCSHKGTLSCSITVQPGVSATCLCISPIKGVAITSSAMVGSGGSGSGYTFSATGLPAGLSMSSSGVISGTPTVSGTFNYTVTITDSKGNKGTLNCSITVQPGISATCLSIDAVQGDSIVSATLVGSGGTGPYSFTATGLPAGLTISTSGAISGTPTVSGTFNYTVTITDSKGNKGTLSCSIVVLPPVSVSCVTFNAVQGVAITPVSLTGSGGAGGAYTYTATGLPPGLTMSSSGVITGTPTASGTFNYTVTITDTGGNQGSGRCSHKGTLSCSITVQPGISATCLSIDAVQGDAIVSATLVGSGGTGPYTFTATGLPAGLSISTSGTISGTPTVSGTFNYTVTITDSKGNKGTLSCSIVVLPPVSVSCVTFNAVQGVAITPVSLTGSGGAGGAYTYTATGLPPGLSMSSSGVISGTPTASGTFNYTVTITDTGGNQGSGRCSHKGTLTCSITVTSHVSATCLCISPVKGVAITSSAMVGSGGSGGYTFSATGLPAGLSMSSSGVISGTPTVTGTFSYTVTITDSKGNKGTLSCSITVVTPVTGTAKCANGSKGKSITPITISCSGGTGTGYTYKGTNLPPGLNVSSSGVISGTPTSSGSYNYTVTVTDSGGHSGTVNCMSSISN
jgi:hypothetical protein